MIEWYRRPWSEIVKELGSNIYYGLDEDQIEPHRERYGKNKILMPNTKSFFYLIITQLKEIWVLILILCLAIFIYLKMFIATGITLIILIANILCIALAQYKEEKNIKELQKLNSGYARVIRDGRTFKILSEDLVVGDIVIVGQGEGIPADMRIVESNDLKVDECSVTGEKFISEKYETKIEDRELALSDMKNILFKSSRVVHGDGTGIVIATGMNTQIANIIKLLFDENHNKTSFGCRLHKILNTFCLVILVSLVIINLVTFGFKRDMRYILKESALIILNASPQGMVLILSLISIILFKELNKRHIFFKDLSSIERFSKVSAICTDKVGAFSKNKMETVKAYGNNNFIDIEEECEKNDIDENLYRMINIGLLCNDTKVFDGKMENPKEDLMEIALVKFGIKNGIDKKRLERDHRRILQVSFDTERRIMTTVNRIDKNYRANIKGAVDSIIDRCTHIMKNGVEMEITEEDINAIRDADINMSNQCLHVIGFAYRNFSYEPSLKENIESNLVFVGLMGFENMMKEDASESINKSMKLCIRPIIITEDTKLTAFAVGKKLGLISRLQEIVSGVEIDNMSEEEFERIGEKISIFSRINSSHKVKMIKALKNYGYVTALTGWKLTDLPALKMSSIGITTTNSNIVKKLSDIFVGNIDFMNLLNIVEDSRKIVNVIKKIIIYIISCSMGLLLFMLLNLLFKRDISYAIIESLWFNNIIMFLSAVTLIYQYKDESSESTSIMIDRDIMRDRLSFIIISGVLIGASAFFSLQLTSYKGSNFSVFTSLTVLNLSAVLFIYSFCDKKLFKNKVSNAIIVLELLIQFLMMIVFNDFTIMLDVTYWKTIAIFAVGWFIFCLFYKLDKEDYYD